MLQCRYGATAAVIGSRLYVCGGCNNHDCLSSLECFDPVADTWEIMPSMSQRRSHVAAAVIAGRLYICGGFLVLTVLQSRATVACVTVHVFQTSFVSCKAGHVETHDPSDLAEEHDHTIDAKCRHLLANLHSSFSESSR